MNEQCSRCKNPGGGASRFGLDSESRLEREAIRLIVFFAALVGGAKIFVCVAAMANDWRR
jgi:hypothetical protein